MTEKGFRELIATVTGEVAEALAQVEPAQAGALADAVLAAGQVFLTGEGRSGLVARSFAMRLSHLGRRAYVAGETTIPAAGPGDLLVAISASGHTRVTAARVTSARQAGVKVAVITRTADSPLGAQADLVVAVPPFSSQQFSGTLFEQAALLLLDGLVLLLQRRLEQTHAEMEARHATLE